MMKVYPGFDIPNTDEKGFPDFYRMKSYLFLEGYWGTRMENGLFLV